VRALLAIVAAATLVATAAAGRAAAEGSAGRSAFHVGDSLASGTAAYLGGYLRGWDIDQLVRVGLQSSEVPGALRRLGGALPGVVLVSAGTNGSPAAVPSFVRDVRAVLRIAGPGRCVVWSNVVRPPYRGTGYGRLNRALAALDRRHRALVVLDWAGLVRRHPQWLRADGVHANGRGYRARARALAALAERCPR
jgi:lysophospholipase L1-like esterase